MIWKFTSFCILAFCVVACSQQEQSSVVKISNGDRIIEVFIPKAYLDRERPELPVGFIWINFDYPSLLPASKDAGSESRVSVLILSKENRKTQAEYMLDAEVRHEHKSDFLERKQRTLEISEVVTDRQGSTYIKKTVFSRADDGNLICYSLVPGLKINASRRYSKYIELRYIISPSLFAERENVDASVVALLNKFMNNQATDLADRPAARNH